MTQPESVVSFGTIGSAFKAGDALSEWMATVAIAANDLDTVSGWLDEPDSHSHIYLFRVAVGHFFEICKYLEAKEKEPVIAEFLAELGDDANTYHDAMKVYANRKALLARIRGSSAFHYGPTSLKRPLIRKALGAVAAEPGGFTVGRLHFADEIVAAGFTLECGGDRDDANPAGSLLFDVAGAAIDLRDFAYAAVGRFVER